MENKKMGNLVKVYTFTLIVLFALVFIKMSIDNEKAVKILSNLMLYSFIANICLIVALINDKLSIVTKIFLSVFVILLIVCFYTVSSRIDYLIYFSFSFISVVFLIVMVFYSFFKKSRTFLIDGLILAIFCFGYFFYKSLELYKKVTFTGYDNIILPLVIASSLLALVFAALSFISSKKTTSIGKSIGSSCGMFIVIAFLLFFFAHTNFTTIDYSLDSSKGNSEDYKILSKSSDSNRSGTSFEFVIMLSGKKTKINVSYVTYSKYDENDYITLTEYSGFFDVTYYVQE